MNEIKTYEVMFRLLTPDAVNARNVWFSSGPLTLKRALEYKSDFESNPPKNLIVDDLHIVEAEYE